MDKNNKILVFGASLKEHRYSNIVMHRLIHQGYNCIGMGLKAGPVLDTDIFTFDHKITHIHTITMYMNAKRQEAYIDQILSYNPKRIIFNPGAENPVLFNIGEANSIEVENACSLVLLSRGIF